MKSDLMKGAGRVENKVQAKVIRQGKAGTNPKSESTRAPQPGNQG